MKVEFISFPDGKEKFEVVGSATKIRITDESTGNWSESVYSTKHLLKLLIDLVYPATRLSEFEEVFGKKKD